MEVKDGLLQLFDVDHGACALLTLPSGQGGFRRVLIDCGHSAAQQDKGGWTPGAHFKRLNVDFVDLLICTNFDEDHASGAPSLVAHGIRVGCILGNPTVPAHVIEHLKTEDGMGRGIQVIANSLADRHAKGSVQAPPPIPGLGLRWFWNPWPHWSDENNLSLVAHLNIHGWNFLFPGDLEVKGWRNMLNLQSFADLMPGVHVLMAAHHGRENGKSTELFEQYGCNPDLVVISDCKKKFQSQETVPYYRSRSKGVNAFRGDGPRSVLTTRSDKDICFRFERGYCEVF